MLPEACDIITALWQGDWVTIRGEHLDVEDALISVVPVGDPAATLRFFTDEVLPLLG
jgi:alkanesulfonate monooxygenase SsuD/methylene tetrahydromethanopterin reductase-like flavin-dependent oxidoreductase (luciferase family)